MCLLLIEFMMLGFGPKAADALHNFEGRKKIFTHLFQQFNSLTSTRQSENIHVIYPFNNAMTYHISYNWMGVA